LAAATADLSTLVTAVKAAGLVDTLSGKGPFTVFAPTNEAFAKLDKDLLAALLKPENKAKLADVLTYHVVAAEAKSTDLKNGEEIKTVEGKEVKVTISGKNVKINNADVTTADVLATNGVVHIIDSVLVPPGFVPPTPKPPTPPAPAQKNIVDLAVGNSDLSTLVTALKAAKLTDTLSGTGPFTVFAPTNEAFAKVDKRVLDYLLEPSHVEELKKVLTYHVASGAVKSTDLKNHEFIKTVEGSHVFVTIADNSVFINNAKVTTADVGATNGVVHIVDHVLIPHYLSEAAQAPSDKNIVELAAATADLSTLVTAVKAAGLVDTLSGKGPFTVFAPTNEAFAKLDKDLLAALLKPENKAKLADVLTYHVVAAEAKSTDLKNGEEIKTVEGKEVKVTLHGGHVKINKADVTTADVLATNGVVHIIDSVLVPPGFVPPATLIMV